MGELALVRDDAPDISDSVALQIVDEAERLLDVVEVPAEAEDVYRRMRAVEEAAKYARLSAVVQAAMARVRLRAERRWGELLGPAQHGGDRRSEQVSAANLNGADRFAQNQARKVAAVPEPIFEAHVAQEEPDALTRAALLRQAEAARAEAERMASPPPPPASRPDALREHLDAKPPGDSRYQRIVGWAHDLDGLPEPENLYVPDGAGHAEAMDAALARLLPWLERWQAEWNRRKGME